MPPTPDPASSTENEYRWFDSWSEGPFSHQEISALVAENPHAAHHFHLLAQPNQTYARVVPPHRTFPSS